MFLSSKEHCYSQKIFQTARKLVDLRAFINHITHSGATYIPPWAGLILLAMKKDIIHRHKWSPNVRDQGRWLSVVHKQLDLLAKLHCEIKSFSSGLEFTRSPAEKWNDPTKPLKPRRKKEAFFFKKNTNSDTLKLNKSGKGISTKQRFLHNTSWSFFYWS